jgi:hypothetical protein
VADQEGVQVEHIVQDACSDDGTQEWLPKDTRVKAFIEKDQGMYDAVNRGFRRSQGEFLAYLNGDEQYLPGALKAVAAFFAAHPEVDVVLSDTVVTDAAGNHVCYRYSLRPMGPELWVCFPVLSCALFIRRRVLDSMGIYFDTRWRDLGDLFWLMEFVKRKLKFAVLPRFTSVFTDTGENMNLKPNAIRERKLKWEMAPKWVKPLRLPLIILNRLRLIARGACFQKPFDYSLYTLANPAQRVTRRAVMPTSFWKGRMQLLLRNRESLPPSWLETYRLTKRRLLTQFAESPRDRLPLLRQLSLHWLAALVSYAGLAGVAVLDYVTGPYITLAPFYVIPSAILTLAINYRWGTIAAVIAAATWSLLQNAGDGFGLSAVVFWNFAMRFIQLQIIVLLLNSARTEAVPAGGNG